MTDRLDRGVALPLIKVDLQLPLASLGVKYNLWGNLLVSGNVLFPLTDNGLRDRLTPVIGFDYSF